jgi:hypothetical protein
MLFEGIRETAPMEKVPEPVAVISSLASSESTGEEKARGNLA